MATGLSIKVEARQARRALARLGRDLDERGALKAIGLRKLKWVDDNFRADGALAGGWAPLSPNTVAGRRRSSSKPLQDTGRMKQSYVSEVSGNQVSVGTNIQYAEFHQEGTAPYVIVPKRGRVLRFITTAGPTYRPRVQHPGLPARPMLPNRQQATELAVGVLRAIVNKAAVAFNRVR